VHVFRLGDGGSELRERILSNPNPCTCGHDMLFGHRVAAGDFDGDGRADLAVSAIFNDVHLPERKLTWPGAGQVFVYLAPLDGTARITIDNPDPGSDPFPAPGIHCSYQRFGQQLLLCDLTGDGHAEVVVGAPRKDADGTCDAGRVFVYAGHGSTPRPRPTLVLTAPFQLAGGLFGFNLAFGRLGGGLLPDLVAGNLNQIQPAIHVWRSPIPDAGAAPWATFPPPVGFGAHYIESLTAGPLGPRRGDPTAERDELILGDPDFGGGAGRVVITFW
jgi:hypothetical protein